MDVGSAASATPVDVGSAAVRTDDGPTTPAPAPALTTTPPNAPLRPQNSLGIRRALADEGFGLPPRRLDFEVAEVLDDYEPNDDEYEDSQLPPPKRGREDKQQPPQRPSLD